MNDNHRFIFIFDIKNHGPWTIDHGLQRNMGRAFEFRKERKFKRWAKMAVQFTRLGKEIVMAVKAGGGDINTNSRLRTAVQNSKAVNMPKDRVEAAIKRATNRDEKIMKSWYTKVMPHMA
jgi:transcriptional/translational regulatory protein YebC/TACO1